MRLNDILSFLALTNGSTQQRISSHFKELRRNTGLIHVWMECYGSNCSFHRCPDKLLQPIEFHPLSITRSKFLRSTSVLTASNWNKAIQLLHWPLEEKAQEDVGLMLHRNFTCFLETRPQDRSLEMRLRFGHRWMIKLATSRPMRRHPSENSNSSSLKERRQR